MGGCPYDWKAGWQHPYQIGCGGNEVPCIVSGKWYIYVWNCIEKTNCYYCFNDDLFITQEQHKEIVDNQKVYNFK
jgi:hypothetical protein